MKKHNPNYLSKGLLIITLLLAQAATAQTGKETSFKDEINMQGKLAHPVKIQLDEDEPRDGLKMWLNGGLQGSGPTNSSMVGTTIGLNTVVYKKYYLHISQYQSYLSEMTLGPPEPNKAEQISNVAVTGGIYKQLKPNIAVLGSAGMCFGEMEYRGEITSSTFSHNTWGIDRESRTFNSQTINYTGLQVEGTIIFTSGCMGLSVNMFANFHRHSDGGISINLLLGKMR